MTATQATVAWVAPTPSHARLEGHPLGPDGIEQRLEQGAAVDAPPGHPAGQVAVVEAHDDATVQEDDARVAVGVGAVGLDAVDVPVARRQEGGDPVLGTLPTGLALTPR